MRIHESGVSKIKFESNLNLRMQLIETGGDEIIEGNDWGDIYWGVCNGIG